MSNTKEKTDGFNQSVGKLADILNKAEEADADRQKNKTGFLEISIDAIEEDPDQPRTEFDNEFLEWLSSDIKSRGVKTPISVKSKNENGKYKLNHGANRLRASVLAGKTTIPSVIDDQHNAYDQVSENIKRKSLSPLDLAKWIQSRIDSGESRKVIKEKLNVTDSYISQHLSLLKLPDEIMKLLYHSNIVREERILYLIKLCNNDDEDKTLKFCKKIAKNGSTTVREVQIFKDSLKQEETANIQVKQPNDEDDGFQNNQASSNNEAKNNGVIIYVTHNGNKAELIFKQANQSGLFWLKYTNGKMSEVLADEIKLNSIVERKDK